MSPNLDVSIVSTLSEFHALESSWAKLENHFCLSHSWLCTWWEYLGSAKPNSQLCIVKVSEGDQLVGVAPLYIERSKVLGKTIKFLGSGATCSDRMTFPALPGYEPYMAKGVLEMLTHADFAKRFGQVGLIELEGYLGDDPTVNQFVGLCEQANFESDFRELEGCWLISIPDDWDTFRSLIKKRQRRKVNKVDSLLKTGEFETVYCETPEQIRDSWGDFVDLHQKRRNQLGQPGCFLNSEFNQFLSLASERLAEDSRTLLTLIKHQGKPLSAVLCFLSGDCVCVYQSGLNTDLPKFEPGHFANTMTFRVAQERGLTSLDFLRGDESYKADWGCQRATLMRARLVAPTTHAQVRHRIFVGGRQMKTWASELWNWSVASFSRSGNGA
jgi:CelD/BcsL family acetyltransferase involved in cellulose biosynthesis